MGLFDNNNGDTNAWNQQPSYTPEPAEPTSEPEPQPVEVKPAAKPKRAKTASHKAKMTPAQFREAAEALGRADDPNLAAALKAVTGKDDRTAWAYALYSGDVARAVALPLRAGKAGGEAERVIALLTAADKDRSRLKALKTLLPALDQTIPAPPTGDNDYAVAGWAAKALGSMDLSALEALA